jgi:two-component system phosphate regulon sensor histidine kinase PhoR
MEHLVRSMAQITQADQSALFMLDTAKWGQVRLVTLYNPNRPIHLKQNEIVFQLDACPPLREALDSQQQLLLPPGNGNGLTNLYALWREDRAGPTLIQPLTLRGQSLAPQIATLVEYRRRYLELEAEAEAMAEVVQKPAGHLSILEIINDGLVVSDATGQVQLVNRAAERILGKPRAELLNRAIGSIYGAMASTEAGEDLATAFSRRNQPLPTFFENQERAIQGWLIPWRDEQGEWRGIIALFRDVTRENKADKARNDFIAALSRELRGPLTVIKGYSDLMIQGAFDDYSPEQIRLQEIIYTSADRMATVLDNAIQINAQTRRKILPRFEEIEVTKIIDEALREIIPLVRLRKLTLRREIKGDLPSIIADPRHIRQILDNLLANACRFTRPGGYVILRAWLETEQAAQMDRPYLRIAVADNGVGIPRSEHKRIFDPFYQLKNQKVDTEIGMGMGLAVVKDLIELQNGRVWVESVVG